MDRAKFYSKEDLGNGLQLRRAQEVLEIYAPGKTYEDINEILELYNVRLLLKNGLSLKNWDEETIIRYIDITNNFGKDIVSYYRGVVQPASFDNVEFQYQQDFWDVFEKYG